MHLAVADVTPSELFGDTLVNTTVAILAYHYLPDSMYTEVCLPSTSDPVRME